MTGRCGRQGVDPCQCILLLNDTFDVKTNLLLRNYLNYSEVYEMLGFGMRPTCRRLAVQNFFSRITDESMVGQFSCRTIQDAVLCNICQANNPSFLTTVSSDVVQDCKTILDTIKIKEQQDFVPTGRLARIIRQCIANSSTTGRRRSPKKPSDICNIYKHLKVGQETIVTFPSIQRLQEWLGSLIAADLLQLKANPNELLPDISTNSELFPNYNDLPKDHRVPITMILTSRRNL